MLFDLESIWSKSKTHPSHVRPAVLNQITKRPSQPVHNQLTSYLAFLHLKSLMANSCAFILLLSGKLYLSLFLWLQFGLQMLGAKVSVLLSPVVIFTTYPTLSVGQAIHLSAV